MTTNYSLNEFTKNTKPSSQIVGIYAIMNVIDNKIYIGKSKNIRRRISSHINSYHKGMHDNSELNNAINNFGIENFRAIVLHECLPKELNYWEYYFVNKYCTALSEYGYNIENFKRPGFRYTKNQIRNRNIARKKSNKAKGLTKEVISKIRQDYANLMLVEDISKKYNIGIRAVYHIAYNHCHYDPNFIPVKRGNNLKRVQLNDEQLKEIKQSYESGLSIDKVSRKLGLSRNVVYTRLLSLKTQMRK